MRITGLVPFEFCSFPAGIWSPQRVTLVIVNLFLLANFGTLPFPQTSVVSVRNIAVFTVMYSTSHFHFTQSGTSIVVTSDIFLASSSLLMWACFLPLIVWIYSILIILSSFLQFILYSSMFSIDYRVSLSRSQ